MKHRTQEGRFGNAFLIRNMRMLRAIVSCCVPATRTALAPTAEQKPQDRYNQRNRLLLDSSLSRSIAMQAWLSADDAEARLATDTAFRGHTPFWF